MSTVWTTGWEALPANLSSPSLGPAYIRGLKTAIHERMWNEHGTYSNASAGADGSPGKDWVHKAGSAVAYYVTTTPTKRPDASTAFTASDVGRFWVNSTTYGVKALSGTGFRNLASRWVKDRYKSQQLKCQYVSRNDAFPTFKIATTIPTTAYITEIQRIASYAAYYATYYNAVKVTPLNGVGNAFAKKSTSGYYYLSTGYGGAGVAGDLMEVLVWYYV